MLLLQRGGVGYVFWCVFGTHLMRSWAGALRLVHFLCVSVYIYSKDCLCFSVCASPSTPMGSEVPSLDALAGEAASWPSHALLFTSLVTPNLKFLASPSARQSAEHCVSDPNLGPLLFAHYIVHEAPMQMHIFGGFVRDTVLHGEAAHDIDVSVPGGTRCLREALKHLVAWVQDAANRHLGLVCVRKLPSNCEHVLRASFKRKRGRPFAVEFVDGDFFAAEAPWVDADVNNLKLVPGGLAHHRPGQGGPIDAIVRRALRKEFVLLVHRRRQQQRARKLGQRGWTMVPESATHASSPSSPSQSNSAEGRRLSSLFIGSCADQRQSLCDRE